MRYIRIVTGVLDFYINKFPSGTIFPTQSIETWQCPGYPVNPANCPTNDMPTISGLHVILKRVIASGLVNDSTLISKYQKYLQTLPPLPIAQEATSGVEKLAPCSQCPPKTSNVENAELYAGILYILYTCNVLLILL